MTIKKTIELENPFEPNDSTKEDTFQINLSIFNQSRQPVNWPVHAKTGFFRTSDKITVKRESKDKFTVVIDPPKDAVPQPYTLRVELIRFHDGKPQEPAVIHVPISLGKSSKLLKTATKDIEDLKKIHNTEYFNNNKFDYVQNFLLDPSKLNYAELTELKKKIDAIYNAMPQGEKAKYKQYYDAMVKYYQPLDQYLLHKQALETSIKSLEAQMGKWAFKRDSKGNITGLEDKTWKDPIYVERSKKVIERVDQIRKSIVNFVHFAEIILNSTNNTAEA